MAFKLGMTVDVFMAYLLMLVSMTLALMHVHSGSAKANIHGCICSTTKQSTSIKLATLVGPFLRDLGFANVYMAWPSCFFYILLETNEEQKVTVNNNICLTEGTAWRNGMWLRLFHPNFHIGVCFLSMSSCTIEIQSVLSSSKIMIIIIIIIIIIITIITTTTKIIPVSHTMPSLQRVPSAIRNVKSQQT